MPRKIESLFIRYRRRGDLVALGAVFDRVAAELLRVANHLTRDPVEAEDVLQETFLTALGQAQGYDETRPLTPWLVGILKNHARRLHRRRERASLGFEGVKADAGSESALPGIPWTATVSTVVHELEAPYREVLVLRLQHDKSPAEIALLLERPPATVRSQLHRGLDQLRRKLPRDARTHALSTLPLPLGMAAVRERVLAHAGTLVAASALSGGSASFLIGGFLMTQKQLVACASVLLVALLAGGLWWAGALDPAHDDPASETAQVDAPDEVPARAAGTTELIGSGKAPLERSEADAAAARGAKTWPPEMAIPKDKGSVAGTIRFEDGEPLVGATVALWGSPRVAATTDDQGRFHIHADWVHGRSLFLALGSSDQPDWLGLILSKDITMKPGSLVMQDITLKRGMQVRSTVVDGYSGKPIPDAQVTLRRVPHQPGQANSGFAVTTGKGIFTFPYVPPGTYTVAFECKGYEASQHKFDLTSDVLPKEFTLTPSRPLLIQLEGMPKGAAGTEVTCDLNLIQKPGNGQVFSTSTKVVIQPDGSLELDAPEAGRYRATIFRSSHLPRMERELEIPSGRVELVTWRVPDGARVTGRIRDGKGRLVTDTPISISGGPRSRKTDEKGRFDIPYVPEGTRTIKVRTGGSWVTIGSVEVPASGEVEVDVQAAGAATLRGRFLVGSQPADRYMSMLQLRRPGSNAEVARIRHDATGAFEVSLLPGGEYVLAAWSNAGKPRDTEVKLTNGEVTDVGDLALEAYVRLPVQFVLPRDQVLPRGVGVEARRWSETKQAYLPLTGYETNNVIIGSQVRLETTEEGHQVTGLLPGPVRLTIRVPGYEEFVLDVEAASEKRPPVEVRLIPQAR